MRTMTVKETKTTTGGKTYYCPWGDKSSSNFWTVYAHAVACGYRHGYFDVPIAMIKAGLRLR